MTIDLAKLREAAARAIPLGARGKARRVDEEKSAVAARMLERWNRQFESDDWFARRLEADGLDAENLCALLAEAGDALAERTAPEPWLQWLASSFVERPAGAEIPLHHAFARLFAPLLASAERRLREGIRLVTSIAPFGTPDGLTAYFLPSLFSAVHVMAERTMLLELNIARVTGQFTSDSPRDRYLEFARRVSDPSAALAFLIEYPVLARQVTLFAEGWVRVHLELVERLANDRAALSETFGGGANLGRLAAVDVGLGDRHRRGETVSGLTFESGVRVVYKPRRLDLDRHFQELLDWLNPQLRYPLRAPIYLFRETYGWVEWVRAEPCCNDDELERFYHRAGALLAVFYLLDATDCHVQNVLPAGDHPVAIDLEALLQPELAGPVKRQSVSERLAATHSAHSVLRVGMLPHRAWSDASANGADVSALGWTPDQIEPQETAVIVDEGTDAARIEYRRPRMEGFAQSDKRPTRIYDFIDALDAGFTEAYRSFLAGGASVRERLLAFARDEVRVLVRDTREYGRLLLASFHPDSLRDALHRDRHFDRLWAGAMTNEVLLPFIAHERRDLWANDIPIFTSRPDTTDVFGSSGARIANVLEAPAMENALAKLEHLGEEDLARQRYLCATAIALGAATRSSKSPVTSPNRPPSNATPNAPTDAAAIASRACDGASAVAERLLRIAYRGPGDLAWVGPNMTGTMWAVAPIGPDLYTGNAGVTLFFEYLAHQSGMREHLTAADAAGVTFRMQLERRAGYLKNGFESAGGVLFALAHLQTLRPDAALDSLVPKILDVVASLVDDDRAYDVMAGCAGSIGGIAAWHAARPDRRNLDILRACSDHLVAHAAPQGAGVGWIPHGLRAVVDRPLAGFAHGGSGIAWALVKAARLLGEVRYLDTARAALAYERTLFDIGAGNWADVRQKPPSYPALWCHGAMGIGLSRAAMRDDLDDPALNEELDAATRTVLREGFGGNFSLCHGDLGNLDLLHAVGMPRDTLLRRTAAILDGLSERGYVCGLPRGVESPSLMVGLAGIGYGLLRAADPDAVPSVLLMQPPARRE